MAETIGGGPHTRILTSSAGAGSRAYEIVSEAIIKCYGGSSYLDDVWGDKANATIPLLGSIVEDIVNIEVWVVPGQCIQLILQQDILIIDICENQVHLGRVVSSIPRSAADDSFANLEHWSDASTASKHTNVSNHVGLVFHCTLWSPDIHHLPNLHACDIFGDISGRIRLDNEFKVALGVVRSDGGIRSYYRLLLSVDMC